MNSSKNSVTEQTLLFLMPEHMSFGKWYYTIQQDKSAVTYHSSCTPEIIRRFIPLILSTGWEGAHSKVSCWAIYWLLCVLPCWLGHAYGSASVPTVLKVLKRRKKSDGFGRGHRHRYYQSPWSQPILLWVFFFIWWPHIFKPFCYSSNLPKDFKNCKNDSSLKE